MNDKAHTAAVSLTVAELALRAFKRMQGRNSGKTKENPVRDITTVTMTSVALNAEDKQDV